MMTGLRERIGHRNTRFGVFDIPGQTEEPQVRITPLKPWTTQLAERLREPRRVIGRPLAESFDLSSLANLCPMPVALCPILLLAMLCCLPSPAQAQYSAPPASTQPFGEKYHVEVSGSLWNPDLTGLISSQQLGIIGSQIDFVTDLGFQKTRFKDFSLVLRPAKKHRFRLQYTPITYTANSTLNRTVVFNGIAYPLSLPIASEFDWKVLRFGYEYDFIYRDHGFFGVYVEGRYTHLLASLTSRSPLVVANEFTEAKAPLPAIGLIGRVYPAKIVSLTFEAGGARVPMILNKYDGHYFDVNIYGTINLAQYAGVQVGWRKMQTRLDIAKDSVDFNFQGLWFGGALRF